MFTKLNILADHAAEHLIEISHERIDIQNPWLEYLLAAEGEQLARK